VGEDAAAVELHQAEIDTRDISVEMCSFCRNDVVGDQTRSFWQAPLTSLARLMRGFVGGPIEEQRYDDWANDFYNNCFYAKRIKVDGVERELAYATTGSAVPRGLHGIFWMDMFYQSSIAKDPAYENKPWWIKDLQKVFPNIVPAMVAPDRETLIAFGDEPAGWFPEEKILKNVGYCGEKGHWTFPNVISGQIQTEGVMLARMNADLVFENEDMSQIYICPRVRDPLTKRWIEAPRCVFEMLMFKTEWGWDRKTSVGNLEACMQHPEVVEKLMPPFVSKFMECGATPNEWNYPMVQIVDGDGNRTKYYDEYLEFMKYWGSDEQIVIARRECRNFGCFSF
jgi:hypothetical protein